MHKFAMAMGLLLLVSPLTGCSSVKNLLGMGVDDTVLPGAREAAIPGKPSFPDPNDAPPTIEQPGGGVAQSASPNQAPGQQTASGPLPEVKSACKPSDPKCKPATGGTFNDPQ
ncbi:MAG: hypothetical protein HY245_11980 [Rhizobiales bacterium]|nr:hypothetical protein [Hyphomicrobiales bacterium]MBI3674106.1 hypothetical protein [Hyphomicrobiales bacterium]